MSRLAPAALAALLALAGCPRPGAAPGPTGAAQPSTEEKIEDQRRRLAGDYQCRVELGDETFAGSCAIQPVGDGFELVMRGDARVLRGQVSATDSGFRLEGTLACAGADGCTDDEVDTDFFEQDDGAYHGVFAVESASAVANAVVTRP